MAAHIEADIHSSSSSAVSGAMIADYINTKLQRAVGRCQNSRCDFADPIFQAGDNHPYEPASSAISLTTPS